MTTIYEKITIEAEQERFVSRTCDWCGIEMSERYGARREMYGERKATFEFMQGAAYPDGGRLGGWEIEDLCDACIPRLRRLFEDAGITISEVDINW